MSTSPTLDVPISSFRNSLLRVLLADATIAAAFYAMFPRRSGGLLLLALAIPFVFLLAFRPVVARLAVRNALRRPRETVLLLLGAAVATVIVTSSLLVGSSFRASLRRSMIEQLGPVDELVVTNGLENAAAINEAVARAQAATSSDAGGPIHSMLPMALATASASTVDERGGSARSVARAQLLELDFAKARELGRNPSAVGLSGDTPVPGTVVAGEDLASALGIGRNDKIRVNLYGTSMTLTVARIAPRRGVAGLWTSPGSRSLNLFLAPGTLKSFVEKGGDAARDAPPRSAVAVSNGEGVFGGGKLSKAAVDALENAIGPGVTAQSGAGQPNAQDAIVSVPTSTLQASVIDVKRQAIVRADALKSYTTPLLNALAGLSIVAGALLLIALYLLLASERANENRMLRTVGVGKGQLTAALTLESWFYALVAGFAGMIGGVIAARIMIGAVERVAGSERGMEMTFSAPIRDVVNGMASGVVLVLLTAFLASTWVASGTVFGSPRPTADTAPMLRRFGGTFVILATAAIGVLWTLLSLKNSHALGLFVGLGLVFSTAGLFAARLRPPRTAATQAGAAVALWGVVGPKLLAGRMPVPATALAAAGALTVLGAVSVLCAQSGFISRIAVAMSNRLPFSKRHERQLSSQLGVANSSARPFRSAVIVAAIGVFVLTMSLTTVLSKQAAGAVQRRTDAAKGGYDILIRSNPSNPVPMKPIRERTEVRALAALVDGTAEMVDSSGAVIGSTVTGFGRDYADNGPAVLVARDKGYPSDAEAYRAVASTTGVAIVPVSVVREIKPGDIVYARDPESGRSLSLRVAAVAQASLPDDSVLVGSETFKNLLGRNPRPNRLAIALAPGADIDRLSREISEEFRAHGAEPATFETLARQNLAAQIRVVRLLQGLLLLELLAGAAGLGVVMLRSVRERHTEIAMLRAIGYRASTIGRALRIEALLLTVQGIAVGLFAGMLTARRMAAIGALGERLAMSIPWGRLLALAVATVAVTMLATVIPARRAAAIRPAAALRNV